MKNLFLLTIFTVLLTSCSQKRAVTVSPDSNLQVNVFFNENKKLMYNVESKTKTVIEDSPLGLILDKFPLDAELSITKVENSDIKTEEFDMLTGKQSHIKHSYQETILTLENKTKEQMQLIVRAYNTGVAFRYKMNLGDQSHLVTKELTGFRLPEGKAWLMPYDAPSKYTPAYEAAYQSELDVNAQSPTKAGWAFPALFLVNNKWVLISESDEDGGYCSVHLSSPADRLYSIALPEQGDANGKYSASPTIKDNWQSPWRVIIVGDELSTIFESTLVHALSRPSTLQDTSWIKTGLASWSWWWDNDSPEDYEKLKTFVDFGHKMGWKHSLVDAKWDTMKGGDIAKLCEYAATKDVNIWVWYNSGGIHNDDHLQPRGYVHNSEVRHKEFKRIADLGVKGIKVDYFHSDKQEVVQLYIDIMEDAAKYNLMVNFHGCKLPNGWERTYPNLMTMEAVRGGECYKLDPQFPDDAITHNSILPFTRNVIGSMDYTPTTFSMHTHAHKTSNAHELALSVVFESGIQHLADDSKMYEKQPDFVLDFLKVLPSTWKQSKLLNGYPGRDIMVARQNNDKWFVAGINSENKSKDYELTFPFLTEETKRLKLIVDGADKASFEEKIIEVNSQSKITLTMLPEGGFCGVIE